MMNILDDLAADHARFRKYLVSYREEIGKMARGEDADVRLLELLATYFAQFPDELHHKKEDIIFACLEPKARARHLSLQNLHKEHEEISRRASHFAEIMRAVLNDEELSIENIVREAEDYASTLAKHMQNEEQSLFQPSRELFTDADWAGVNKELAELYAIKANSQKMQDVRAIEELLESCLET